MVKPELGPIVNVGSLCLEAVDELPNQPTPINYNPFHYFLWDIKNLIFSQPRLLLAVDKNLWCYGMDCALNAA